MKKFIALLLIIALTLSVIACGSQSGTDTVGSSETNGETSSETSSETSGKTYELRLGHTGAPSHHYQEVLTLFAEDVEEKTNGRLKVLVFPSDQLGNQMESTEGTMLGTHDMVLTSDMVLSNWVPEMGLLTLPFIFEDNDHIKRFVNSDVADQFADLANPTGAMVLAFWDNGFRHITNSIRPINSPEDLDGLKIRVPEGEIFLDTFTTLGAIPTVISFGELYSSLQLNTVDGQENPPAHVITQKFYEVQDYISRTNHMHSLSPLLINKAKFESLPEDLQKTLSESAKEYAIKHIDRVEELEADQWVEIGEQGMAINDVDSAPFEEAVKPVIDKARDQYGSELIDGIMNLRDN